MTQRQLAEKNQADRNRTQKDASHNRGLHGISRPVMHRSTHTLSSVHGSSALRHTPGISNWISEFVRNFFQFPLLRPRLRLPLPLPMPRTDPQTPASVPRPLPARRPSKDSRPALRKGFLVQILPDDHQLLPTISNFLIPDFFHFGFEIRVIRRPFFRGVSAHQ